MSSVSSTSTASATLSTLLSDSTLKNIGNTTNSTTDGSTGLSVAGLASGTDWTTTVEELANAERAPETQWEAQQTTLNTQNSAYTTMDGDLTTLQTDVETLQDSSLYSGTTAQSSNSSVATATSEAGATLGSFTFNITQLATASQLNGAGGISQNLVPDGNAADVTATTAAFATPVTTGTFTVNGDTVTVAATDTLQDVFNNIATATDNAVTASYDASTDKITLASSSPIVLGTATDTSNFLQSAGLYNNPSGALAIPNDDPTAVTVADAGFSTQATAGTFTVNGDAVTIAATDTLQDVFDKIATATSNAVTASYDAATGKIALASSSPITLGSSSDTSNFLQAAGLDDSITSNTALGTVQLSSDMAASGLKTALTDGGNGEGAFTINGVTINYDASTDSISDVLDRINTSSAGVTASYNNLTNNFVLANNTTGAVGISAQDVTGNFLTATGLANGTLQEGDNLLYTVNGGSTQLISQSNTITSASSGINGLTLTPLETGSTTVSVSSDTAAITTAINQFITDYNAAQTYITNEQAVSTSSTGTSTPGTLTGDLTANGIATGLRSITNQPVTGLSGALTMLSDLGIQTNGQNNTISLSTPTTLQTALTSNLSAVQSFFSGTNGWGAQVNSFLNATIGSGGTIPNQQATLTQEDSNITTQISNLETKITSDSAHWTSEFEAMEVAESQTNQEMTYLSEQVTNGTL